MPHFFVFFLLAVLAAFGGTRQDATPPPAAARDTLLTLPMGVPVAVDGASMSLTFDAVLADGRCPAQLLEGSDQPIMMQCTVSLPVEVAVSARRGDTVEHLTFVADTDTLGYVTANVRNTTPVQRSGWHTFVLEAVQPYPLVGVPRDEAAYTLTLRVTRDEDTGPRPPVTDSPGAMPAQLGAAVTLGVGQTAVMDAGTVRVTVDEVDDRRCPRLAACAAPSIVVVEMAAEIAGETLPVSVGGVTDENGRVAGPLMETRGIPWALAGDYAFELLAVTPYPQHSGPAAPGDFAVTFVVTAREQSQPAPLPATPSPIPTAASDVPVLSFDAAGNAVLCVSERALVELAAGASDQSPAQGTPLPLGAVSLPTAAAGNKICAMFFGAGWRIATMGDLTMSFAAHLPSAGVYWVWDDAAATAVPWPGE